MTVTLFELLLVWFVLASALMALRLLKSELSVPMRLGLVTGQALVMSLFFWNWFVLGPQDPTLYAVLFWGSLTVSNLLLSTVGVLEGHRTPAFVGIGLTVFALFSLVVLHAFGSLYVIALASPICLLAALWKRRQTAPAVT